MLIRIINSPTGPAPEDVRRAWIGVTLPLLPGYERRVLGFGLFTFKFPMSIFGRLFALLTGNFRMMPGYLVDANEAVERLSRSAPAAASWWREQAPHFIAPGKVFLFNSD